MRFIVNENAIPQNKFTLFISELIKSTINAITGIINSAIHIAPNVSEIAQADTIAKNNKIVGLVIVFIVLNCLVNRQEMYLLVLVLVY